MEKFDRLTFSTVFQEFISFYLKEYGEKKAKEIADKVNGSNKCNKLLIEANRLQIRLGSDDLMTSVLSNIGFSFAKAETVCFATVLLFFRWQQEIGVPLGIADEDYLNTIFFRILDKSNKFKTHINSNQNFFEKFYSLLEKKLDEFDEKEEFSNNDDCEPRSRLIIPGIGIDGIKINETTYSDVLKKYGKGYDIINHNNFSYEINYSSLGISCYYKHEDPMKRIFFITLKREFEAYTEAGIVFDWNRDLSVGQIETLYGTNDRFLSSMGSDQAYLSYSGIMFYVDKDDIQIKSKADIYVNSIAIF